MSSSSSGLKVFSLLLHNTLKGNIGLFTQYLYITFLLMIVVTGTFQMNVVVWLILIMCSLHNTNFSLNPDTIRLSHYLLEFWMILILWSSVFLNVYNLQNCTWKKLHSCFWGCGNNWMRFQKTKYENVEI